ncbi:MAG: polysaccharide deacetylase family protein [Bacteroidia bacterium]|nr:polysaccharide deacetylase family protein [Bacteroidia bacterium]
MILIYCPEENPRVTWTFDLVFRQLLGLEYRLTTFPDELIHSDGPRLNYSFKPIAGTPFVEASGLLFENDVRDQSAKLIPGEKWARLPTIFSYVKSPTPLSFDIFSAIFFFVSRYEEYLPFEPDEHHRFRSTESLAFHLGIVENPIVNQWVIEFKEILLSWFGESVACKEPEYQFIPTIDIDNAWAYAHKGLMRSLGGLWKDRRDMEARNFRYQVLRDNQPDPYNTYELLNRFHSESKVHPIWFFLVASYGHYDKNISPHNIHFQNLIRQIAADSAVGIHPSYASNSSPSLFQHENELLARILGRSIHQSRQHYLRLHLPDTYRTLSHLGIREDYSMGYADSAGFRAGIASPFRFFDLEENKITDLMVYPFQVMDTCLQQYMKLNPEQSVKKITEIVDQVKKVKGTFISLWHNESLSEWNDWSGWSKVYRELLSIAKPE